MKPMLNADLKLAEVITHYPETRNVFNAHGLGALVSTDGMRALAPFLLQYFRPDFHPWETDERRDLMERFREATHSYSSL